MLALARRVLDQKQQQRGPKVYSLHAPEVECIGKGTHRPYEFGLKVSVATTLSHVRGGQLVTHVKALTGNPYDGHTLRWLSLLCAKSSPSSSSDFSSFQAEIRILQGGVTSRVKKKKQLQQESCFLFNETELPISGNAQGRARSFTAVGNKADAQEAKNHHGPGGDLRDRSC